MGAEADNLRELIVESERRSSKDELIEIIDEKHEQIDELLGVIKDIYAVRGEDEAIASRCNPILNDSRFSRL